MPTKNVNLLKEFVPPFSGVLSAGKVHKFPSINSQTTNSCIAAAQVWDGRAGEDRAGVLPLPKEQMSLLNPEEIALVLKATFLQVEARLLKEPGIKQAAQIMGTTATIALDYTYQPQPNESGKRYVVLANVGDSSLWVMVDGNCTQHAIIHDVYNVEEQERVIKAGGTVDDSVGYFVLCSNSTSENISGDLLAVSRAFGDEVFCQIGLSHDPSIHIVPIENPKTKVSVIGASDGFTDYGVTEEVILECEEKSPTEIIDLLTEEALNPCGHDDDEEDDENESDSEEDENESDEEEDDDDDKGIFCLQTNGEEPLCGIICDGHGGELNKGPAKKNPVLNFVFSNLPQVFLKTIKIAVQIKRSGQEISQVLLNQLSTSKISPSVTEASSSAPASSTCTSSSENIFLQEMPCSVSCQGAQESLCSPSNTAISCGGGASSSTSVLIAATNSHVALPMPSVSSSFSSGLFPRAPTVTKEGSGSTTRTSAFTL